MNVNGLKPAAYNPRTISEEQLKALAKSLHKFGDLSGIVFNRRTKSLVGGHQRTKTFDPSWEIIGASADGLTDADRSVGTVAMGFILTPFGRLHYREVDWDQRMEAAANIAANKHGGDWDIPKLKDLLTGLDDGAFDMELTGFNEKELQGLVDYAGKAGVVTEPDAEAAAKAKNEFRARLSPDRMATVQAALKVALGDLGDHLDREDANGLALFKLAEFYLNRNTGAA